MSMWMMLYSYWVLGPLAILRGYRKAIYLKISTGTALHVCESGNRAGHGTIFCPVLNLRDIAGPLDHCVVVLRLM